MKAILETIILFLSLFSAPTNAETVYIQKPVETATAIPTIAAQVIILTEEPTLQPVNTEILINTSTPVIPPTEQPTQIQIIEVAGVYDPSLYDEWHPYVEPTQSASTSP